MLAVKIMTFGDILKGLLRDSGLSEQELAEKSGVAYGTVHMYTQGFRKPSYANVAKLCNALDVSLDVFRKCDEVTGKPIPKKNTRGKRK